MMGRRGVLLILIREKYVMKLDDDLIVVFVFDYAKVITLLFDVTQLLLIQLK